MENIGEVALYIKGKVSTTYTVLELGYGGGVSRTVRRIFTAMEFIGCCVFID